MSRALCLVLLALALGALTGCGSARSIDASAVASAVPAGPSYAGAPRLVDGLRLPARVQGKELALGTPGGFAGRFWPGVNLGSTTPGHQPGELAARAADYRRWFPQMAALGARVVRVYTILPPAFYRELRAYDLAHPADPLYVVHGVWIPEERFLATENAYDPEIIREFHAELRDASAVVHGDADLPVRPGHASGHYDASIAPWLLGWSVGVEWDPHATQHSDEINAGRPAYHGTRITTRGNPTPMESWIAMHLDFLAGLEARRGWSEPITFTNWLTTDPLKHPAEPLDQEDLVSVDAMHLTATGRWPAGFFASYHAYPYYPDFLRLEPRYQRYRRADGVVDPYAGYLHDLRAHHRGQAVMITEFGQPTSIGLAHLGPLGRNQGGHSEQDGADQNAQLLSDIRSEGFAGGVLFEWADEWFKFTWNTTDLETPGDRRQLWRNPLTNEEHFGVIATEPGRRPAAVVDGSDGEWTRTQSQVIQEGRDEVREIRATHDEEYLYLRLRLNRPLAGGPPLQIGFDVRPGDNRGLPGTLGIDPQADVALKITPGHATLRQAAWTDPISFMYGVAHSYVPVRRSDLVMGSGAWVSPRLILNRPYRIPTTGREHPVEITDIGNLGWGTTDPSAPGFDDRHLVDARGDVVELRIPWSMLTFSDPSTHRVYVPHLDGTVSSQAVGRMGITVFRGVQVTKTAGYAWEPWQTVAYHERRKRGWSTLQHAFAAAAAGGVIR